MSGLLAIVRVRLLAVEDAAVAAGVHALGEKTCACDAGFLGRSRRSCCARIALGPLGRVHRDPVASGTTPLTVMP
jgi:hypothetical protein